MRKTTLIIMLFMWFLPDSILAQWSFDVPSIEAYISDHKNQRSLLIARSTIESSNVLLHKYSAEANSNYKDINIQLDKYTRAFDVIDVLYQTLRTSFNAHDTYNCINTRIADYKDMLRAYHDKCLKRADIVSTDTLIISVNAEMLKMVAGECQCIYKSFSDLILYATGATGCSTSNLLLILESINRSIDNIRKSINRAYFETWKYIQVRIGYWKAQVYRAQTVSEIIEDSFHRWIESGRIK